MSTDRFLICLPHILAQECPFPNDWSNPHNFSNDAHDPGGKTMCGIIQREYSIYRKSHGLPVRDVRLITQKEGEDIYRSSYWMPECPKLKPGLDLVYFDESVNAGPHAANVLLQRALGLELIDGVWGPQTDAAVDAVTDVPTMIKKFTYEREAYYRSLPGFVYFGRGWINRSVTIEVSALKMVS